MSISVVNRKDYLGTGTYIGPGTVFSNRFTGDGALENFKQDAYNRLETDEYFRLCLYTLAGRHKDGESVVLACSCKPEPCHGDIIAELIEQLVEFKVV